MITKYIDFKNFRIKKDNKKIKKNLDIILKKKNSILESLRPGYKNNYNKETI